jgi:hypothetical protein
VIGYVLSQSDRDTHEPEYTRGRPVQFQNFRNISKTIEDQMGNLISYDAEAVAMGRVLDSDIVSIAHKRLNETTGQFDTIYSVYRLKMLKNGHAMNLNKVLLMRIDDENLA